MAVCHDKIGAVQAAGELLNETPGFNPARAVCYCATCASSRTGPPIGGFPNINPTGWIEFRCGLNPAQEAIVAANSHPIAYHGSTLTRVRNLLATPNGAPQLVPPNVVRADGSVSPIDRHHIQQSFNRINHNDQRKELFDAPACIFGSPDPAYAELYCRTEVHTVRGASVSLQVALKLRYAPNTFGVGQHTLKQSETVKLKTICAVDTRALEYYTNRQGVVFVETVLLRVKPEQALRWPPKLPRVVGTPPITVPRGCLVCAPDTARPWSAGQDTRTIAVQQLAALGLANAMELVVVTEVKRTSKRYFWSAGTLVSEQFGASVMPASMASHLAPASTTTSSSWWSRNVVTRTVTKAPIPAVSAGVAAGGLGFAINFAVDGASTYFSDAPDKYKKFKDKQVQENVPGAVVDFACTAAAGAILGASTWPGLAVGFGARAAVHVYTGL